MVLKSARGVARKSGIKLQSHEGFLGNVVFTAKTELPGGGETEARVVLRVPENNNRAVPAPPALVETGANQRRADAFSLSAWYDGHRGKAHDSECRPAGEGNRRKQNVADDCLVVLGDERNDRASLFAQNVNEIGFR